MSTPDFWVVIPAAGIGARMRADRPKQYLAAGRRTILEHTLELLSRPSTLAWPGVGLAAQGPGGQLGGRSRSAYWPSLACFLDDPRISRADGGAERADSVLQGLLRLTELGATEHDWVLVRTMLHGRSQICRAYDLDRLLTELAAGVIRSAVCWPCRCATPSNVPAPMAGWRMAPSTAAGDLASLHTDQQTHLGPEVVVADTAPRRRCAAGAGAPAGKPGRRCAGALARSSPATGTGRSRAVRHPAPPSPLLQRQLPCYPHLYFTALLLEMPQVAAANQAVVLA